MQLVSVLREVKYLELEDPEDIPSVASNIFNQKESFRQYVANLDLTEQWYNKVINLLNLSHWPKDTYI